MYRNLPKIQPVRWLQNRLKVPPVTRTGMPVGLSNGQHEGLHQGLYASLHQGFKASGLDSVDAGQQLSSAQNVARSLSPTNASTLNATNLSPGTNIRQVSLLSSERVINAYSFEKGLVSDPQETGRMLVLTNHRIIAFGQQNGSRETVMIPVDEVKAVAVNGGRRSKGSLLQGGIMVLAGVVFYVLMAYWLTGRVDGPTIPVIRMDLVSFLIFLAVLSGVGMMAQYYFSKPNGEVTFQGDGVKFTFPFRGENSEEQIYQMVNAAFAARQSIVGSSGLMADR